MWVYGLSQSLLLLSGARILSGGMGVPGVVVHRGTGTTSGRLWDSSTSLETIGVKDGRDRLPWVHKDQGGWVVGVKPFPLPGFFYRTCRVLPVSDPVSMFERLQPLCRNYRSPGRWGGV